MFLRRYCTRNLIERSFAVLATELNPVIEMNSVEGILNTLQESRLYTILPEMALRCRAGMGLAHCEILGADLQRRLIILWRRNGYRSPLALKFASEIKKWVTP